MEDMVLILSRQGDEPTIDIRLIQEELSSRGIKCKVLCKTLNKNILSAISYCIHMLVQMYYISRSRVIVLDGYCILVSNLKKKKGQKVVQIWHALGAVKKFGWQNVGMLDGNGETISSIMNLHGNYDYVIAPSDITAKYFSKAFNTPLSRIERYALPRVDYLKDGIVSSILDSYPVLNNGKVNVLYAPTFRRGRSVKVYDVINNFDFEKYNLILKKHWLDKSDYSQFKGKGLIIDDKFSGMEWLKVCDKVITDYSAIVFEAAVLERDIYLYLQDIDTYNKYSGINMDFSKEPIAGYVCYSSDKLCSLLDSKYNKNAVKEFKNKYIDVNSVCCTKDLVDFIVR